MDKRILNSFLMAVGISLLSIIVSDAEASNLDRYKDIILSKNYTIKCTNITPVPRQTNKDAVYLYGSSNINTSEAHLLTNKNTTTCVVSKGDTRYQDVGYNIFFSCLYQKDNKLYIFTKFKEGAKSIDDVNDKTKPWVYMGNKKNVIYSDDLAPITQIQTGIGFGTPELTRALNAFLPNDQKGLAMGKFHYVNEGTLGNGLNYVDYRNDDESCFEVIRYYFNGTNMVKIAYALYYNDDNGVMNGRNSIIRIDEFSSTPDPEYIDLPKYVKLQESKSFKKDKEED